MIYKPRPYQTAAVKKIIDNPATALFLDMGMGKTVATLTAINELIYDRFEVNKVLVIAPLRVARTTWKDEVEQWQHLKHLKVSVLCGSLKEREAALTTSADIYTINMENVAWLVQKCGSAWPFDMVVIDESSAFKNPQAKRFRALRTIRPKIKRLVELTGTPSPNGLMDLWSQIYLLDKGERLGKTITQYRSTYFRPGRSNGYIVYEYIPLPDSEEKIFEKIKDLCLSLKSEDYIELPECIYNEVRVDLSPAILNKYKKFQRDLIMAMDDKEITATSAATLSGKLLQFASGAMYDDDGNTLIIHDAKLEALKEIQATNENKNLMVMYWYKHDYERLKKAFPAAVKLDTTQSLRDWNKGKIKIGLLHPASAGHGLNLQFGGNVVVWYSLTWNLELYQQANKRLHRPGQQNAVIIHHLVAKDTIDMRIMEALKDKAHSQNKMIEALKALIKETTKWS